jgi:hypothetical protein
MRKQKFYWIGFRSFSMCLLILMMALTTRGQYLYDYQKIVDILPLEQRNYTLTTTNDAGYFVVTMPTSNSNEARLMCYKFDASLNVMWTSPLEFARGATADITAKDVKQCQDGGYIICGRIIIEGSYTGGFLLRLDPGGNMQWFKHYTDNIVNDLNSVVETPVGFISVGTTIPNGFSPDGIILATDNMGGVQWSQRVVGTKTVQGYTGGTVLKQVISVDENNYALVGSTNIFFDLVATYESDAVVITFDLGGAINGNWVYGNQWQIGRTADENGSAIRYKSQTGSFVLLGDALSGATHTCTAQAYNDAWVWEIDALTGNIIWNYRYNILNHSGAACAELRPITTDLDIDEQDDGTGSIAFTGWAFTDLIAPNMNEDAFICRLSSDGIMYDHRLYADETSNRSFRISRTDHQSWVTAGYTDQGFNNELWLVESYDVIGDRCNMINPIYDQVEWVVDIQNSNIINAIPKGYNINIDPTHLSFNEIDICERIPLKSGSSYFKQSKEDRLTNNVQFNVYKNASGNMQVVLPDNDAYSTVLLDLSGKQVGRYTLHNQDQINTNELPSGIYIIRCVSYKNQFVQKIQIN